MRIDDMSQTSKKKILGVGIIVACMCTHTFAHTYSHTHTVHMRFIDDISQTSKKK